LTVTLAFSVDYKSARALHNCQRARHEGVQEQKMQMAITFMAVVAGLIFSIAIALLAEELIFGQVFRLFFSPQTQTAQGKTARR
jgi:hypothetical protein